VIRALLIVSRNLPCLNFRSVLEGEVFPGPAGARVDVRMRLHPAVLAFGAVLAVIAGTIAAIAAPEIPVVGGSPLLVRILAMATVSFLFAALASIEARTATRLLSDWVSANPNTAARAPATAAGQRR
jgi:hypothetical protein